MARNGLNNNPWLFFGPWIFTFIVLVAIFAVWFNL